MKKYLSWLIFVILAGLFLSLGIVNSSATPNQTAQVVVTPHPPQLPESEPFSDLEYLPSEPGSTSQRVAYLAEPEPQSQHRGFTRPILAEAASTIYMWQPVDNPSNQQLNQVSMLSATDGWAVGDYGTIMHWDGVSWQVMPSPTPMCLYDIFMLSATDGWIVGGWDPVNNLDVSIILHWDGISWQPVVSPTTIPLSSISMLSSSDGWIVGGSTPYSVILHWNGSAWSVVPSAAPFGAILLGVDMLSATDGWAVGNYGTILHWNGSAWQLVPSPTIKYIIGIDMLTASDGWAVGGQVPDGEIFHWNGTAWSLVTTPAINEMMGVSMVSADDGWATSYWGGQILHWDGASWSIISNQYSARGIQMLSATDGWIMGNDILHYTEFNGLAVYVENAIGLPADARVYAYTSDGGYIGYSETGEDGYAYLDIAPGSYTLYAKSSGVNHFLITQSAVASPGATSMSAVGTPQVTLYAIKRDGAPLGSAYIYVGFSADYLQLEWNLGVTNIDGGMVFNVSPGFYDLGVVSWTDRYFLYTLDQDFTDPASTLLFDTYTGPSAEIVVAHPDISVSTLALFPANGYYGFGFSNLSDGMGVVVSSGLGYWGYQRFVLDDLDGNHWRYHMEGSNDNITLAPGEVYTYSVGGPLTFTSRTDDATVESYLQLAETPLDSFGNILTSVYFYTADNSTRYYVYPQVRLTDPSAQQIVQDWFWYFLPTIAPTGMYTVDATWETGPYQGLLEATSQFEVLPQQVSAVIPSSGGTLQSYWDATNYEFPAGTFSEDVIVTHTVRYTDIPPYSPWVDIGHFFDLSAVYVSSGLPAEPINPYTIYIPYSNYQSSLVIEGSLGLFFWNGSAWELEPSSFVDPLNNYLMASPDHFSTWGVLGDSNRVFLAIVQK